MKNDERENVYQLVRGKGLLQSEWMYEMASSEKNSTFALYNKAWDLSLQGNYEVARENLNQFKEGMERQSSPDQVVGGTQYLDNIIARGESEHRFRYVCVCENWKPTNNL